MIPLPSPFLVIPPDGSDPVYIHEAPDDLQRRPMLGVTLVTPRVAQMWLHAGQPVFYPVVIQCQDDDAISMVAGQKILKEAVSSSQPTPAAVVKIGEPLADTAVAAVEAMRKATGETESVPDTAGDIEAVILSDDGGVVLGGAEALWDLRTNKVMLVLVINPADRANPDVAAAPFN